MSKTTKKQNNVKKPVAGKTATGTKKPVRAGKSATGANKGSGRATQPVKRTKKNKNISQEIENGTFVITNDQYFYGTDGKSNKTRMGTVVDSNKKNELAITKITTSEKHGKEFENDKGFKNHGDKIYTLDNEGNPIKLGEGKFSRGNPKRDIPPKTANEIKRRNVKESPYKAGNQKNLQNLKGRNKKKKKK